MEPVTATKMATAAATGNGDENGNGGGNGGGTGNGDENGDGGDGDGSGDGLPSLSIADATVVEGTTAEFDVTLNRASDRAVTVQFGTADETAVAGADYTARSGTLTFAPGSTRESIAVSDAR